MLNEENEFKWFEFRAIADSCQELIGSIGHGLKPDFEERFGNKAGTRGMISRNNIYYRIFLGLLRI